jgi:hypothetical protein
VPARFAGGAPLSDKVALTANGRQWTPELDAG